RVRGARWGAGRRGTTAPCTGPGQAEYTGYDLVPVCMTTERATARVPAMTTFNAVVAEVVVETPDTITAVLDIGVPAKYRAGQYVSIDPHQFPSLRSMTTYLEHMKGRAEPPRAYSMSS